MGEEYNPIILPELSDIEIKRVVEGMPDLLKWDEKIEMRNIEANKFLELPVDLQYRIFSFLPKFPQIKSEFYHNSYLMKTYYDNCLMNEPITREEVLRYLNSLNDDDNAFFGTFRIHNEETVSVSFMEDYMITKRSPTDIILVYDSTVKRFESCEKLLAYLEDDVIPYSLLFNMEFTGTIAKQRILPCQYNESYSKEYTLNIVRATMLYFYSYPLLISTYLTMNEYEFNTKYEEYMSKLVKKLGDIDEKSMFTQIDEGSLKTLWELFNLGVI